MANFFADPVAYVIPVFPDPIPAGGIPGDTTGELMRLNLYQVKQASEFDHAQRTIKTAIVAALPQTSGSLHRFLGPFARAGVNLCRIVSRPVPGQPETYVFYLEVEGYADETRVMKALSGAKRLSVRLEILGSYGTRPRYRSR
jgi:prephenate dehydratase